MLGKRSDSSEPLGERDGVPSASRSGGGLLLRHAGRRGGGAGGSRLPTCKPAPGASKAPAGRVSPALPVTAHQFGRDKARFHSSSSSARGRGFPPMSALASGEAVSCTLVSFRPRFSSMRFCFWKVLLSRNGSRAQSQELGGCPRREGVEDLCHCPSTNGLSCWTILPTCKQGVGSHVAVPTWCPKLVHFGSLSCSSWG